MTLKEDAPVIAATAVMGAAAGTAAAMMGKQLPHLHRTAAFAPTANFTQAAVSAIQQGGTVTGAIGAGATALVGGPAVVAGAVAAAPFVIGGIALGAIGYGLYALLSEE